MLIGKSSKKPSLETVRRIKSALRTVLKLPENATITVSQLACLEQDCAPLETVIGLLRPGVPQLQYKIHKAIDDLESADLVQVCTVWDFEVQIAAIEPLLTSNHISRR